MVQCHLPFAAFPDITFIITLSSNLDIEEDTLCQHIFILIFFISYLILIKANADVWNEGFSDNPLT